MIDLKQFRKANKITRSEMAAFFGVSEPFISQIENGRSKLPESKADSLINNDRGWIVPDGIAQMGDNAIAKVAKVDEGGMLAAIVAKIDAQNARFEEQNRQIDRLLTIVEQLTQQKK